MNELQSKRIMIVEDNITNLAVYSVAFRDSGAVVFMDPFNTNTLYMIKRNLPLDIILLDLMLRLDESGYDVFDAMQADPELWGIPVIAVSATDPAIAIPRVQEKGFTGFMGKPIDRHKLIEQVAACLNGEKVWYSQEAGLRGF